MNELTPVESPHDIPAKLDVAKRALAEATEDWQRIDIRNYAAAVAAATAILERRDIQVQAANLVQDAERAIVKANPPMTPKDKQKLSLAASRKNKFGMSSEDSANSHEQSADLIRDKDREIVKQDLITKNQLVGMREAHSHMSDEEFEAKKTEAVATGVPLTQLSLRQKGREKRRSEKREERESQLAEEKTQIEMMLEEDPNRFLHIRLDEGLVNWHNVLAHTGGPGKGNDLGKMTVAEVRQLQKDFQRVMHPDKNSWYAERTHQEQLNWIALRGVIEAVLESLERQITINVTGGKHEKL